VDKERKHKRVAPLLLRVEFRFQEDICRGYVTNLSQGGAFLVTRELFPVGSNLSLRLKLPDPAGLIVIQAKVVRRRPEVSSSRGGKTPGVGVEFISLDTEAAQKIQQYLFTLLETTPQNLVS